MEPTSRLSFYMPWSPNQSQRKVTRGSALAGSTPCPADGHAQASCDRLATPDEISALSLEKVESILVCRRLHTADQKPAALIPSRLPSAGLATLAEEALDAPPLCHRSMAWPGFTSGTRAVGGSAARPSRPIEPQPQSRRLPRTARCWSGIAISMELPR